MEGIYTCRMKKEIIFSVKANSMQEAQDWCATHDFEDVQNKSSSYDIDYSESVSECSNRKYKPIDIRR